MPQGTSAGARGAGRFYRAAALNVTSALTTIAFDADSAIMVPVNVGLNSGDIETAVGGKGLVVVSLTGAGALLLTGCNLVITRSPGTGRELKVVDATLRGVVASGAFTIEHAASLDMIIGDTLRFELAAIGATPIVMTTGEYGMWSHLIIG